jgi:chitin synthase
MIIGFASVMIIPMIYYVVAAIWLPRTALERLQYLVGLAIFTVCGPFLNICVLVYALYNMDSFGWGKTRIVVTEESGGGKRHENVYEKRESRQDEESQLGALFHPFDAFLNPHYSMVIEKPAMTKSGSLF